MAEANASTDLMVNQGGTQLAPAGELSPSTEIEENKASPLATLGNVDTLRQITLIIALAITLALVVFVMIWAQEPDYRPLGKMETEQLIETLDYLDQQKIDYKLEGNVILLPEDKFADIRLKLTRAGLGAERAQDNYLNQETGFGVSQRMERARLKHNQELELGRAVAELRAIQRARVILALPQQNVFARKQRQPSATVVVTLARGAELRQSEVDAVVDIVASAVHGLKPAKVTVTDQHGRLLNSGSQDGLSAQARRELELQTRQEQLYRDKIDSILIPVLGLGKYTAQVDVSMDFSTKEETSRRFNPETAALRSEMVVDDEQNGRGAIGIPGALSNQPPMEAKIGGQDERRAGSNGRKHTEATRNYELDSTVSHVRQQTGTIQRVTLSVAVDYKAGTDGALTPRTDAELQDIKRLLQGTVGFSQARGDVLEVVSVPFADELALDPIEMPFYEQPWFWRAIKMGIGALGVLVLIFAVVRPMTRKLINPTAAEEEDKAKPAPGAELAEIEEQYANEALEILESSQGDYSYADDGSIVLPDLHKDDDMLRAIRALVANEPALSTQVVKSWLTLDES